MATESTSESLPVATEQQPTALSPVKKSSWLARVVKLTILAAVVWVGWREGPLVYHLAWSAHESFQGGPVDHFALHMDNEKALCQFTPRQLSKYLRSPTESWRAVVSGVLISRDVSKKPEDWSGTAEILANKALTDPNPIVREYLTTAIGRLPSATDADADALMAKFAGAPDPFQFATMRALVKASDHGRALVRDTLKLWATSNDQTRAETAINHLGTYFPDEDAFCEQHVVDVMQRAEAPPEFPVALIHRRPSVGALLLAAPKTQATCFRALIRLMTDPTAFSRSWTPEHDSLVTTAESTALAAIAKIGNDREFFSSPATSFLSVSPNGEHLLAATACEANNPQCGRLLVYLNYILYNNPIAQSNLLTRSKNRRLLDSAQAQALLKRMRELEANGKKALSNIIFEHIQGKQPFVFDKKSGPFDPNLASMFRPMMDDDQVGWCYVRYFTSVAPLTEDDVPKMANWVRRRATLEPKLDSHGREMASYLQTKFSKHPSVTTLELDLSALKNRKQLDSSREMTDQERQEYSKAMSSRSSSAGVDRATEQKMRESEKRKQ